MFTAIELEVNVSKDISAWCINSRFLLQLLALAVIAAALTPEVRSQSAYSWRTFARLEDGRQQFSASWIGKDRLIVIGGKIDGTGQMNGTPTNRCELIDLATSSVRQAGVMLVPRAEHVSLVDPRDSSILVIGGVTTADFAGEVTNVIERYNPLLDEWSAIGYTLIGRRQHTAYWISQTEILIVGGRESNLTSLAHAEIFDVRQKKSRRIADFPSALNSLQSITVGEYDGVVFGGRTGGPNSGRTPKGYRYNSLQDQWVEVFDLNVPVSAPTPIGTWGGPALVSGGAISEAPFDSIEDVWIVKDGTPQPIGKMQNGRQWHSVAQLNRDTLIAGAGYDDGIVIRATCDWIDIATGFVHPGPALNVERAYPVFASIPTHFSGSTPTDAIVLAISGLRQDGSLEPTVEMLVRECDGELDLLSGSVYKNFVGSASQKGQSLLLTDTTTFQSGAVWVTRRVQVGPSLDLNLSFRLHNGNDHNLPDGGPQGADGIAVVIQNVVASGVGDAGRGIGYDGIAHGVAIEFDSYENAAFSDPNGSHVAVQVGNGQKLFASHTPDNNIAIATDGVPEFVADGRTYYARVSWAGDVLRVWISDSPALGEPVITVGLDLDEVLRLDADQRAWVGLTSATGFSTQVHEVTSWTLGSCDPLLVSVDDDAPSASPSLRIAPSPADQQAVVTLPAGMVGGWTLRVVSMDGRTVFATVGDDAAVQPTVPAQELAAGMYAVVLTSGQRTWSTMWSVVR